MPIRQLSGLGVFAGGASSSKDAAREVLRVFNRGSQAPPGVDALFRKPQPSALRCLPAAATISAFCIAISAAVLLFVTRARRKALAVASTVTRQAGGVTVTLTLVEPSQLDSLPDEWRQVFREAGVTKKDLADPATAQVIADALSEFKEELAEMPALQHGAARHPS